MKKKFDKFYTKVEIVKKFILIIKKKIKIDKKRDLIIEPSCGNGVFIDDIKRLSDNYLFYDILPENKLIIKKDYLKLDLNNLKNKFKKIHIIGNPPFGRQSSLALKFIKHSSKYCSSISFILPKSFLKESLKDRVPLDFFCIYEKEVPKNSFLLEEKDYDVPCIYQIWVKKKGLKRVISDREEPLGYRFVKKEESPDISIRRVGSKTGEMSFDVENKNKNTHYFLKVEENNLDKIVDKMSRMEFKESDNTVGPKSISKRELIRKLN